MERVDCDDRWGKGLWLFREGGSSHRNGEEGEIGQGFGKVSEEVYGRISGWISVERSTGRGTCGLELGRIRVNDKQLQMSFPKRES